MSRIHRAASARADLNHYLTGERFCPSCQAYKPDRGFLKRIGPKNTRYICPACQQAAKKRIETCPTTA
jgi:hypothetical protein